MYVYCRQNPQALHWQYDVAQSLFHNCLSLSCILMVVATNADGSGSASASTTGSVLFVVRAEAPADTTVTSNTQERWCLRGLAVLGVLVAATALGGFVWVVVWRMSSWGQPVGFVTLYDKPAQVPPPAPPALATATTAVVVTADATADATADVTDTPDFSTSALPTCIELVNVTDEHTYWRQDLAANRTTWLHLWAMLGQSDKLVPLVADGANVNARDAAGRTAAMVAAASGQHALPSLVTLCGSASWNPSATCARGFTLWQYLQQCGQLRAARALRGHFHV
jgi:hypothetical protein